MTKKKLLNKPSFKPKKYRKLLREETSLVAWESSCIYTSIVCVTRSFDFVFKKFLNILFTFISFYDDDMESL